MYNEYEEYMRSVLGYNTAGSNTYTMNEHNYSNGIRVNQNMQEVNHLYPEIYGIVYPLVQKMCSKRINIPITEEEISQMADEIYDIIEPNNETQESATNIKNGDVRNPRVKEMRRQPRRNNGLLRDLIKILLIRELFGDRRNNLYGNEPQIPRFDGIGSYMPNNPRLF